MNKKADIWISAVIYVALGVVILAVVLAATTPAINKMRDRNTYLQTKEVMHKIDSTIKDVLREGPGAQRTASIEIQRGEFSITTGTDNPTTTPPTIAPKKINWVGPSRYIASQEGSTITEGNIKISTTKQGSQYQITLTLDYTNALAGLTTDLKTLSGKYNLLIKNEDAGKISIKSI
ncbi:MAG: hypothetical protein PHD81_00435 [Candidatus Nanoarchaeia archaeon]|nr:hypothetical protein [Candidatus Nanoarchaeia archaeon]MDD5587557.1 hypothetical protein [Candidatus Nanoarchaeia archaeon]